MRNETVLVVDDSPDIRFAMAEVLKAKGFCVESASDGQEAIEILDTRFFDIVLTDLSMPRKTGMDVLKFINENSPETICMIITGYGTIQGAVEALKLGAYDYLCKPIKPDEVIILIDKALEIRNLRRENKNLKKELKNKYGFKNIIGSSPAMKDVFSLVEKVADADSTVLITGESGTGKELIAHAIHYASDRKDNPFIPVNCAAIPEELLESELFGHEKGAFTHAIKTRIGRFELANKGTIFLDEIGEMSPSLQVKLLRVLQERKFERVGGVKTISVDIRVVAATNKDLEAAVREGKFREDLFYRLNVIPIHIPPLRERQSDIPLLVEYFLKRYSREKGRGVEGISEDAMKILMRYEWPGNVRELENIIERLVILSSGRIIKKEDLPVQIVEKAGVQPPTALPSGEIEIPEEGLSLSEAVSNLEKTLILKALERTGGIKNRAAKLLRMNRTTLIEKMKKLGLMPKSKKAA